MGARMGETFLELQIKELEISMILGIILITY